MPANVQALPIAFGPAYIRPAEIIQMTPRHVYRVRLAGAGALQEMTARLATAPARPLKIGDRVLLAGENSNTGYIIGILHPDQRGAIATEDGAGARIHGQGKDQAIAVHDARGQTVFEYFPARGRSVIRASRGDLQLSAPDGSIELQAGEGIRCTSAADITITGHKTVQVSAGGRDRIAGQSIRMDDDGVHFGVHTFDLDAGQGRFHIGRASYQGIYVSSCIERAKLSYGRLEIAAQRILQRSGQLFHQVKHLCQMQAGRLRTLVTGAHHVQSKRTTLIAEEDVRIDAKKINLG